MKKRLLIVCCSLALTACTPAQTAGIVDAVLPASSKGKPGIGSTLAADFKPENPTWVYQQFFIDAASRTKACQEGYNSAAADASSVSKGVVVFRSTEGSLSFQNNTRDTAQVCRDLALKGDALPDSVPPQGVDVIARYKGSSNSKPLVVLAFYDKAGKELLRMPILNSENRYSFVSYDRGDAIYGLNLPEGSFSLGQKTTIATAERFKVLVDFGRGIETFEVTQQALQ